MIVLEVVLLLFLVLCALACVTTRRLLAAVIIWMSYSSIMAILWMLLESPDLAVTEAAVGAGITSLLFFLALRKINGLKGVDRDENSRPGEDWFARLLRWAEDGESGPVPGGGARARGSGPGRIHGLSGVPGCPPLCGLHGLSDDARAGGREPGRGAPLAGAGRAGARPSPAQIPAGPPAPSDPGCTRVLSAAVAGLLMATLVWVAVQLPAFGDPQAPGVNEVSRRYLEQGVEETGAVNAVTG